MIKDAYLDLEKEIIWELGFPKVICCPNDWYEPIKKCWDTIKLLDPTITVAQIKEKFWGLRFYVEYTDNEDVETNAKVDLAIRKAEKEVEALENARLKQ